jgi:protein SCO1
MVITRHRRRSATFAGPCQSGPTARAADPRLVAGSRRTRPRLALVASAVALLVTAVALAGCGGSSGPKIVQASASGSRFDGMSAQGLTAPNFTLHDQHGQAIRLSAERGKFVLLTFLYVHCKNVCPVIAGQLNQALRDLPATSRQQVRVLAVSVDPKGDTPAAVAHFIALHRLLPQFLYLTGTARTLQPIWDGYHIASVQAGDGVVVGHTALVILLNRGGQPQAVYDATVTPQQVLHDLRVLGLQV